KRNHASALSAKCHRVRTSQPEYPSDWRICRSTVPQISSQVVRFHNRAAEWQLMSRPTHDSALIGVGGLAQYPQFSKRISNGLWLGSLLFGVGIGAYTNTGFRA